ncbi:sensor histidine kinase [Providencia rettgeri]|uniref:sensor histidine kinase n=1 Tax=Providencia TaxID=586 RepID=UPI0012B62C42|nr:MULTISPECIES: sensor histidine kinase [Providencia]ELR5229993.1 sensor histidine kinase [Providencia rettgeri]MTC50075.1 ATP-binding protein [Providencia alcalifaciens]
MQNERELRNTLAKLLEDTNNPLDYGELIDLTTKISSFDKENIRFSVDANLIKRLGEQLVAKKTTALSELIKNAYDAEASEVSVFFDNTNEAGGEISILDNGNGMSKNDLIKGFMKISTSDKEDNPISPLYERSRAGRKGIGRFSAQKIGKKLKIITRKSIKDPFLLIDIDWDKYQSNTNLLSVNNSIIETSEDFGFEKGTKIIISEVKDIWSDESLKTTYKYISSIIKISPKKLSTGIIDPGFIVNFYFKGRSEEEFNLVKSENTEIIPEADAKIVANINKSGNVSIEIQGIKYKNLNLNYTIDKYVSNELKGINFKLETYYFVIAKGETGKSYLQNYLRDNGGIRFYRNGFYVSPYGETYNDWLGLDNSSRKRTILPPHANTNFLGAIELTDTQGVLFEETSSREGLIENIFFEELRGLLYIIVSDAVLKINANRGIKLKSSQKDFKSEPKTLDNRVLEGIIEISKDLDVIINAKNEININKDNEEIDRIPLNLNAINLKNKIEEQKEVIQEIINEKNLYRVLASTGLAIGEFTHEIQLYLNGLMLSNKQLRRSLPVETQQLDSIDEIDNNINMLVSYTDFFTETIRANSQRIKKSYELRDIISSFFTSVDSTISRRNYTLDIIYEGDEFWIVPVHVSEISSIFMNLFTNSCKAIVRSGVRVGMIRVSVKSSVDGFVIRFEDNGDGIPDTDRNKVFEPLFTTNYNRSPLDNEYQQMVGMGLGLSITRDILIEIDGDISIADPSEGYNTCVQVIIPKANDEDIPENVY